jgi:hypothetical protein
VVPLPTPAATAASLQISSQVKNALRWREMRGRDHECNRDVTTVVPYWQGRKTEKPFRIEYEVHNGKYVK